MQNQLEKLKKRVAKLLYKFASGDIESLKDMQNANGTNVGNELISLYKSCNRKCKNNSTTSPNRKSGKIN